MMMMMCQHLIQRGRFLSRMSLLSLLLHLLHLMCHQSLQWLQLHLQSLRLTDHLYRGALNALTFSLVPLLFLHLLLLLELPCTLLSLLQALHIILPHQNLRIHLLSLAFIAQLILMLASSLGGGGSSSHPLLKAMMRMMRAVEGLSLCAEIVEGAN